LKQVERLRKDLETMVPRVQQVIRQSRARVLGGDVHVAGKLVSVFEPSTEVIRKGKASKPTEFGKMVKIQEAVGEPGQKVASACSNGGMD
jgi:IS5 family transposase